MTLDEAIKHCDEVIEKEDCSKCAKEHEQLKEWLEELKELKNPQPYKFEELKKDMWVWVKKLDGYYKISGVVDLTAENGEKYVDFGFGYIEFKENMFYRKQVQYE